MFESVVMGDGAACKNGGPQKEEAEGEGRGDEWFWLNTVTQRRSETVKKEQPLCPWLDRSGAQVWPGAVSPGRGTGSSGKAS